MPGPLRLQPRHVRVALFLLAAFLAAPAAVADIFKCATKDGTPLYQNFPCQFDSLGSSPSSLLGGKIPSIPYAAGGEKPKIETVNVASTGTAEPRIGMTADEVRALLGEPDDVLEEEPGSGGRVSVWRYAGGTSLQLDNKHRVLGVQR